MASDRMISMVDSSAFERTYEGIEKDKHVLAQRVGWHRSLVILHGGECWKNKVWD